jgi:uncharacterized RDD family membrane protein YckC
MTCQHCQTWILDDDHRCRRCGRRVRATPSRISPATYPIAATATAPAYDFMPEAEAVAPPAQPAASAAAAADPQQVLFTSPVNEPRVIAFDSLTSPAERDAIRSRAKEIERPAPVRNGKVEVRRPRGRRSADPNLQQPLDFLREQDIPRPESSAVICDAPVAPASLRLRATAIDAALMLAGYAVGVALFLYVGGSASLDKHQLPFVAAAAVTIPVLYKLLWAFAGRDSIGLSMAGLQLIDFDGHPPSRARRYQRLFGSFLSVLAAGIGLVWSLFDEDNLTWHDHMSSTFPTFPSE